MYGVDSVEADGIRDPPSACPTLPINQYRNFSHLIEKLFF